MTAAQAKTWTNEPVEVSARRVGIYEDVMTSEDIMAKQYRKGVEASESVTRQALHRELAQKDAEIERLKSETARSERAIRSMIDSKMTCGHPSCYGETLNEKEKK